MADSKQNHPQLGQHQNLPPTVIGPPPYSTLGAIPRTRRTMEASSLKSRSRSRSPNRSEHSPPTKRTHTLSETNSDQDLQMDINNEEESTATSASKNHSFLLTNFDAKFQNPKILFQQVTKYLSRDSIAQIIPTRNGTIIKSPDINFASKIRNRHSFEIFGKNANITRLDQKPLKQPPPPRKPPTLSVVVRGVDPTLTDEEIETELKHEGHSIHKCLRIKAKTGQATYMVRVLTPDQETIDDLLSHGAYIYRRRYRVEPSHSPPPLPIRCEKCQLYNAHPTSKCTNTLKCGFCTGNHSTKTCPNLQQPPTCNTCGDHHTTFSYKCKARPEPDPAKPELIVPIRTPETKTQFTTPVTSVHQPLSIEQLLTFLTVALQNIHPFQRHNIIQQIQYAAKTILNVNFTATYSGPYAYFHAHAYGQETAV